MFCSFMTISQLKCDNCDPGVLIPIMFRSEPCSVLYTPNLIQSGDMLKVDFIMEDYPKASMNMTATNGAQETLEFYNTISKVPIQFIFTVDPAVPDCEEGLYLPKYLPPTPDHEARVYTAVQQSIAIFIQFTANYSSSSELLHNGPLNMTVERTRLKEHALVWIPTEEEIGHHPVCYVLLVTTP
ncbi:hypothetical protein NL108_014392 [Boleophthalmus pectinirostris]|nr:hypothetical protein NL108_014392 [Boleophthalmus pectinirostris]